MGWLFVAVVFFIVLALLLPGLVRSYRTGREQQLSEQAATIRKQMERAFGGVHELREVRLEEFPKLDRNWYEAVTSQLETEHFRCVGDLLDVTLARTFPNLESIVRTFIGDEDRVRVGVLQLRPKGLPRVLQLLRLLPRRIVAVECCSELRDGSFILTNNAQGLDHMALPEQMRAVRLPSSIPPLEVVRRHRARLSGLSEELVLFRDVHALIQSWQRSNVLLSLHREGIGALTRPELEAIVGRALTKTEEALLDKLRPAEGRGPVPPESS